MLNIDRRLCLTILQRRKWHRKKRYPFGMSEVRVRIIALIATEQNHLASKSTSRPSRAILHRRPRSLRTLLRRRSSLSTSIAPSRGVSSRNKSAPLLRRVKHFSSPFLPRIQSMLPPLPPPPLPLSLSFRPNEVHGKPPPRATCWYTRPR